MKQHEAGDRPKWSYSKISRRAVFHDLGIPVFHIDTWMPGRQVLPVLGHAHSLQQHRHGVLAVVRHVDLTDRHGIVRQEIHHPIAIAVPRGIERQHHTVIFQEASPGIIAQHPLDPRRCPALGVTLLRVRIRGKTLLFTDVDTLTRQELSGERVAVDDAINHAINAYEKCTRFNSGSFARPRLSPKRKS